jgi:hypothetical protein
MLAGGALVALTADDYSTICQVESRRLAVADIGEAGRVEAAAKVLGEKFGGAHEVLAAADLWDRENGYVRVKLDGKFATPGGFTYLSNLLKADPTRETLLAVAAALREAAER